MAVRPLSFVWSHSLRTLLSYQETLQTAVERDRTCQENVSQYFLPAWFFMGNTKYSLFEKHLEVDLDYGLNLVMINDSPRTCALAFQPAPEVFKVSSSSLLSSDDPCGESPCRPQLGSQISSPCNADKPATHCTDQGPR